jgi:hypothetical protein
MLVKSYITLWAAMWGYVIEGAIVEANIFFCILGETFHRKLA